MSSVNTFTSYFSNGLARSTDFKAYFDGGIVDNLHLHFSCKSITIPGITLNDSVYDGRKFATGYDLDSFSASFLVDSDGKTLAEMAKWSNAIYNQQTGKFGWKDDYACDVTILLYTRAMEVANTIKMINTFPINITPIDLSWDTADTIVELSVDFDFDEYQIT